MKADRTIGKWLIIVLTVLIILALALVAGAEVGITNLTGLHISGDFGTATPSFMVDRTTASGAVSEMRVAATPVTRASSARFDVWGTGRLYGTQVYTGTTTITMTAGGTLTPTGTWCPITAGAAIGFSTIAQGTAGQLLIIDNVGANAIVITDTTTTMLTGNLTLGQYDTVVLISDGLNWLELSTSNN